MQNIRYPKRSSSLWIRYYCSAKFGPRGYTLPYISYIPTHLSSPWISTFGYICNYIYIILYYTVKLGYNELGYNELPVITNNFFPFFQSQNSYLLHNELGYNELLVITNKFGQSQAVRYNRVWLYYKCLSLQKLNRHEKQLFDDFFFFLAVMFATVSLTSPGKKIKRNFLFRIYDHLIERKEGRTLLSYSVRFWFGTQQKIPKQDQSTILFFLKWTCSNKASIWLVES